jgi:DNA-binding response OmpR family regulator
VIGVHGEPASIACVFDAGADEVVVAPIDARDLMIRVYVAVRRCELTHAADSEGLLGCGAYQLDRRSCVVTVQGEPIRLTPREFAIAWLLFSHDGEYVSRRQIAGAVWSNSEDIVGRTLEQHIYKLRKKLGLHGAHGVRLRTMYSHGYRIEANDTVTEIPVSPLLHAAPCDAQGANLSTHRGSPVPNRLHDNAVC